MGHYVWFRGIHVLCLRHPQLYESIRGIMMCSGALCFKFLDWGIIFLGQGIVRNAPAQNLMPLYFWHFGAYTLLMRAFRALCFGQELPLAGDRAKVLRRRWPGDRSGMDRDGARDDGRTELT